MYWPEAREGVCVSFKIHLALEGKAGGGRWTNQPTTLTELRCCWQKWEHAVFCWHGKGGSKCRKLTLQVTMQLRHIFTEIAANGRGEHMLCIKETTISRCQRVAWGTSTSKWSEQDEMTEWQEHHMFYSDLYADCVNTETPTSTVWDGSELKKGAKQCFHLFWLPSTCWPGSLDTGETHLFSFQERMFLNVFPFQLWSTIICLFVSDPRPWTTTSPSWGNHVQPAGDLLLDSGGVLVKTAANGSC